MTVEIYLKCIGCGELKKVSERMARQVIDHPRKDKLVYRCGDCHADMALEAKAKMCAKSGGNIKFTGLRFSSRSGGVN